MDWVRIKLMARLQLGHLIDKTQKWRGLVVILLRSQIEIFSHYPYANVGGVLHYAILRIHVFVVWLNSHLVTANLFPGGSYAYRRHPGHNCAEAMLYTFSHRRVSSLL